MSSHRLKSCMLPRFSIAVVAIAACFVFAANGVAQVSTATLTGIVTDPSQARVPNVNVKVVNESTGVTAAATTNAQGEYTVPLLPPGRYRLEAEASGFQRYSHSGIVLEIGRVFRLDFSMALGEVSQVVDVSGAAPLLESENATISQLIENKTIIDMPLNGRRVADLVALMGNAILLRSDVFIPRVVVGGGRADEQMWLLDGVTAQNLALEIPQTNFNPPVEAIQEFRVLQNNYSAEYGNTSGGVISFSTKSGTNDLHGNLYEFFRNDKLDARNFFSSQKAPLRWNIFGFAVGGPIRKSRTFFFVSNEWQKQRIGVTRLLAVPTPEQRNGDFSATLNSAGALIRIYDPNTTRPDPASPSRTLRDPFPGNVIPTSRIDPVGQNLVSLYPLPNRLATNLAGANNFGRNAVNGLNSATLSTKVDHVLSDQDRLSGRFVMYDIPRTNTPVFDEPAADPFASRTFPREYSLLINEIHNFSPAMINDFRFDWGPRRFKNLSLGLDQGWPAKLGLRGASDRAFPRVTAAGFSALGPNQQERIQEPIHDTHIVNHLSWFRGAHAYKFGGEVRLARNVDHLNQYMSGLLGFGLQPTALPGTGNTGNSIASMLVGFPNSGQTLDTDELDRRAKYFALFVQDDWKVTSSFTLNIGLRWETHTPRFDANNRQNGFDPTQNNPVSGTPGVITFAGRDGVGSQVYNGDYNNLAPRFGFAWRPFGLEKTLVRAGYGIYFGPPIPGSNNTSAGFANSGNWTTPDNGITAPFLLRDGFPAAVSSELGPGFGAVSVGQSAVFSPEFIERNRRLGYSQQWNFGIQRDMGWETLLEVGYMGNAGHKLAGPNTSINQVRPELMGPGNAQARRPFPQFGNVTSVTPMWGNSSYHSLNIKMEKRFSHGLNFLANYTFSKFIDDVTSRIELGQVGGGIQDLYNRGAEKSLSGNDVRNRFAWSSVYEVPVGQGRRWLNKGAQSAVLGGWNLGFIVVLQQGNPLGLVTQTNTTNAFNPGSQRVDVLRNPTLPQSERALDRWFDTEAVAAPASFTFGNAGRALLTGPGMASVDLSLLKNHRWAERYNLQLRFEAFNLINRVNFGEPGRALGSSGFGVISTAGDARILQFGMKFEF